MNNLAGDQTVNEANTQKRTLPYIKGFVLGIVWLICITVVFITVFGTLENIEVNQRMQQGFNINRILPAFFVFGLILVIHLFYTLILAVPIVIFAVYKQLERNLANFACLVSIHMGLTFVLFGSLLLSEIYLFNFLLMSMTFHALYYVLSVGVVFWFTLPKPMSRFA